MCRKMRAFSKKNKPNNKKKNRGEQQLHLETAVCLNGGCIYKTGRKIQRGAASSAESDVKVNS